MNLPSDTSWLAPPKTVTDIISASKEPAVMLSPDGRHMLLIESAAMPEIEDLARPMLRLAGVRIDPQSHSKFRTRFGSAITCRPVKPIASSSSGSIRPEERVSIKHPDLNFLESEVSDRKIGSIHWSHNGHHFAFEVLHQKGTALFVASVASNNAVLVHPNICTVLVDFEWMPDGESLVMAVLPDSTTNDIPEVPSVPLGPRIEETDGDTSPTRTYQDLLKSRHDEDLFAQIVTSEIITVQVDGSVLHRTSADMYCGASSSPDGNYLLLTTLKRPFSYLLTWRSFAMSVRVTDLEGNPQFTVAEIPVAANIPVEGVRTQPRLIHWMSASPATVCYSTALDGGDPNKKAAFRDRVFQIAAPFGDPPEALMDVQHRFYGLTYFEDGRRVITTEYDRDRRWVTKRLYDLKQAFDQNTIVEDRSIRDRYGDPGHLIQRVNRAGHYVVEELNSEQDHSALVFRAGKGATPEGDLPFLDCQNLSDMSTERLWRCEDGCLESVVSVYQTDDQRSGLLNVLTSFQSPTEPPNLRTRTLTISSTPTLKTTVSPVTHFKDPTPQIRGIKKRLVTYQRSDGTQLSATLYLPEDHQPGQRLPLLVWAYPQEFNDPSTAGQVVGNPRRFTRMTGISHLTLVTLGYAVMDNATMPVIGEPEVMNDTFIEQIIDAAQSAIDFAVAEGVADRDRVAVGGHSYGAFMTANLMAHCDLFQAGIARSGAYNRTLTPFGFQAERRSLWEAPEIYLRISPFMHADKIKRPLLIMHGEKDNNPGTFPLQSERLYQAIKGNGGTARLVILPYESHGYVARQSVMQTQAEMIAWLDKYLKESR